MHPRFYRLLPLLALLLFARLSFAQTINSEAVTAYWQLTDALRHDEPLTDTAWQTFLALPDNKAYVSSTYDEASLRAYRRALEIIYMPRYDSLRQVKLKGGGWFYQLINDYKEHEADYKALMAEITRNPAYLNRMYTYAYEYLPARNHTKVNNLRLAYVAIGNDAISEARGIVFSLRDTRDLNLVRPGILEAHEIHHRLRTSKDFTEEERDKEPLLWALLSAQNEGLADLTDKRVILEQSPDTADSNYIRRWLLAPAPAVIHKIDSTMQVLAVGGPVTPLKFYRLLTNGSNGHLPGFYMAYTILHNGYLKPMLDHADDPIAFALLYQKAAKKDKDHQHPPVFAPASMRYLQQLARKYDKPHKAT